MPDFDLSGELSLKIELHMLRPITEKVHSGIGPVSLVCSSFENQWLSFDDPPFFLICHPKPVIFQFQQQIVFFFSNDSVYNHPF